MDLSKISVLTNDGVWLPITLPDGTVVAEFLMFGRDSDECAAAVRQNVKKSRDRKGKQDLIAEEEESKRTVNMCIKDWRDPDTALPDPKNPKKKDMSTALHELTIGKEKLQCNFLNKKRILDEYGFMYRQADAYIVDDANFFVKAD